MSDAQKVDTSPANVRRLLLNAAARIAELANNAVVGTPEYEDLWAEARAYEVHAAALESTAPLLGRDEFCVKLRQNARRLNEQSTVSMQDAVESAAYGLYRRALIAAPAVRKAEPAPEMKVECAKCFDSGLLSVAYHQIPCGECLAGDRARASLERQGFLAEGR